MLRVLHVVAAGELGGAERMLADLARSSPCDEAMRDIEHTVALFPASSRLHPFFSDHGLRVHARAVHRESAAMYVRRAFGRTELRWLEHIVGQTRSDILHLHTLGSQVLGTRAARRLGKPVLRTEHSTRAFDDPSAWPFSRWSLRRVQASVAISEHVANAVRARAPWASSKLHTVPNGVDTEHFAFTAMPPRTCPSALTFVLSGRLEPRKGIDIALRALALVPEASLRIVGDGPELQALQLLSQSLGLGHRVHFTGFSDNVRAQLGIGHVVLSSSRKEGLGLAVLEAMAMGRPAVAVPVGGLPEFVDASTGFLAEACTAEALAAAMRAAAQCTDLEGLGVAARTRVLNKYSLRAMRSGYARLYRTLAAAESALR